MNNDQKAIQALRDQDHADVPALRRELKTHVVLVLMTAALSLGLVSATGSWFGLLPLFVGPYTMKRMVRVQRELKALEADRPRS